LSPCKKYCTISKPFILQVIVLTISFFFSTSSHAAYFRLKNPPSEVKLYTYQNKGRCFDRDYKKENLPDNEAHFGKRSNGFLELWTCASSWNDASEASIRGIDYRDFEIKADLPPNSKIRCGVSVDFEYGGYANTASSGYARGYYLIQMDMGFLVPSKLESWDHPVLGKTAYLKTNFQTWGEQVVDLTKQVAQDQLEDIISDPFMEMLGPGAEIASLAVNAIKEICQYGDAANVADLITSGQLGGTYNSVWLTIDEKYRTYVTLELHSKAVAPTHSLTNNFAYICFYDHPAFMGRDFRGSLSKMGFGITKVELAGYDKDNIAVPDGYPCPILDISKFGPKSTDPNKLKINTPETFEMIFKNNGKADAPSCKAIIETTNPPDTREITVPYISKGDTWTYTFDHIFKEYGHAEFKITIDPGKVLDKYVDLTKTFTYKYDLTPRYDMLFVEPITVERKDGVEVFQTKKPAVIKGKIKNNGAVSCEKALLKLTKFDNVFKKAEFENIKPGEEKDFSFEFTPEEECTMILKIEAQPSELESDISNNEYKVKIGAVEESKVIWCVKDEDFKITPPSRIINKPVYFEVAIMNDGNAIGEEVKGTVYVRGQGQNKPLKGFEFNNVPPGEKVYINALEWIPEKEGRYTFSVEFAKDKTNAAVIKREPFSKSFYVGLTGMGTVEGIDVVVRESDFYYDEENEILHYTIYNRGTKSAVVIITWYYLFGNGELVGSTPTVGSYGYHKEIKPQGYYKGEISAPRGNYKRKIVVQSVRGDSGHGPVGGQDVDLSNNEAVFTHKEFTPDKIGPNMELIALEIYKQESDTYLKYPKPAREQKLYTLSASVFGVNTGNAGCTQDVDLELMVINKAYPDRIPKITSGKFAEYSADIGAYHYKRKISPMEISYQSVYHDSIKKKIYPASLMQYLGIGSRIGGTGIASNYHIPHDGTFIFDARIDPDGNVANDTSRADNNITLEFSVPDCLEKLKNKQFYLFLLKDGITEKQIKKYKYGDRRDAIILPRSALAEYGFEEK